MDNRVYFSRILSGVGVTGSDVWIDDHFISENQMAVYERVVIENETNNATVARIGKVSPSDFLLYDYKASFNADVPQVLTDFNLVVKPAEFFRVKLTGTTTGDVLRVYVHGYYDLETTD